MGIYYTIISMYEIVNVGVNYEQGFEGEARGFQESEYLARFFSQKSYDLQLVKLHVKR